MTLQMVVVAMVVLLGALLLKRFLRLRPTCRIIQNNEMRWVLTVRNGNPVPLYIDAASTIQSFIDGELRETTHMEDQEVCRRTTLVCPLDALDGDWLHECLMSRVRTEALTTLIYCHETNKEGTLDFRHAFNLELRRFDPIHSCAKVA